MGHYSEMYEEDERLAAARMRRKLLKQYIRMDKAMEEIKSAAWHGSKGMKSAVKELDAQFVLWCHKNELLVEDPQIVIDLLKDEE
jgi:hypothetical protein